MPRRFPLRRALAAIALGAATAIALVAWFAWESRWSYSVAHSYNEDVALRRFPPGAPGGAAWAALTRTWRVGSALVRVDCGPATNAPPKLYPQYGAMLPEEIVAPWSLADVAQEFVTAQPIAEWMSPPGSGFGAREWFASGWPMFAAEWDWRLDKSMARAGPIRGAILMGGFFPDDLAAFSKTRCSISWMMPIRIRPLGFGADTALFAALWYLALGTPGLLRRKWRTRRAQCPTCAYDLRATPANSPCPECGQPAPNSPPIANPYTIAP